MLDTLALSALDWWQEAGVDTIVDESPRDWLAPAIKANAAAPAPAAAPALPPTLAAFRAWLLGDPAIPGPTGGRLDAAGDPASGAMVVIDYPEAGDRRAGQLISGEAGALFDRMLAAIGLSRATLYLAPLSPARPATGRLDAAACAALAAPMRHHIALVRPRRLLLLGEATVRALLDLSGDQARGRRHDLAVGAGTIPAIAGIHPRALLQKVATRADAWADLQSFMAL